jgi:hypothetical protein
MTPNFGKGSKICIRCAEAARQLPVYAAVVRDEGTKIYHTRLWMQEVAIYF